MAEEKTVKDPEHGPDGLPLTFCGVVAKTAAAVFRTVAGYVHTRPATRSEISRGPIHWSPTSEDSAFYNRRRTAEEAKITAPAPAPAR